MKIFSSLTTLINLSHTAKKVSVQLAITQKITPQKFARLVQLQTIWFLYTIDVFPSTWTKLIKKLKKKNNFFFLFILNTQPITNWKYWNKQRKVGKRKKWFTINFYCPYAIFETLCWEEVMCWKTKNISKKTYLESLTLNWSFNKNFSYGRNNAAYMDSTQIRNREKTKKLRLTLKLPFDLHTPTHFSMNCLLSLTIAPTFTVKFFLTKVQKILAPRKLTTKKVLRL